jgi:hypothetical protein
LAEKYSNQLLRSVSIFHLTASMRIGPWLHSSMEMIVLTTWKKGRERGKRLKEWKKGERTKLKRLKE